MRCSTCFRSVPAAALMLLICAPAAMSFCGFYAAKADASLYNNSSRVVFARYGERTVITMENDYEGEPNEFAMIIPVPTVIERQAVRVVPRSSIDALDDYTAPRLAEYFDPPPCEIHRRKFKLDDLLSFGEVAVTMDRMEASSEDFGVQIETQYTVEEYEILILSARDSGGLQTWLKQNQYKIPDGADDVLEAYIKRDMRFFVAKVNLEEQARTGATNLRPLQVEFRTEKFMLPIRLGTVNAKGPQDLTIIMLTPHGRVESSNYRTVKIPTDIEIPTWIKSEFGEFYMAMFDNQIKNTGMRTIQTEYSWSLATKCDPCVAQQPSSQLLAEMGAGLFTEQQTIPATAVHLTRLHVRYTNAGFPEDIVFTETRDQQSFQGRYVIRHAWKGDADCEELESYHAELRERQETTAQALARLTGWDVNSIRQRNRDSMGQFLPVQDNDDGEPRGFWSKVRSWFAGE